MFKNDKVLQNITELLLEYQSELSESIIQMEADVQLLREIANTGQPGRIQTTSRLLSRNRIDYITEIIENYE